MRIESTMKLWTFHPSTLNLHDAERIDHRRGQYWNSDHVVEGKSLRQRYRLVLPMLQRLLGTDQVLWCDTVKDGQVHNELIDQNGWELNVPLSQIAAFYWVMGWEDLLWGRTENWDDLFVEKSAVQPSYEIGALVRFPLERKWVTFLGKPAPCHSTPYDVRKSPLWEMMKKSKRDDLRTMEHRQLRE
jgi:hypothetical protein